MGFFIGSVNVFNYATALANRRLLMKRLLIRLYWGEKGVKYGTRRIGSPSVSGHLSLIGASV